MRNKKVTTKLSNPASTGNIGGVFEAKVQAAFLLHLLIGGRLPCLPDGKVETIRLQAKQAGFDTDDAVVTIQTEAGIRCRLLAQIKHTAAITEGNKEFSAALASAWADFNNPNAFTQEQDAIALVTGPLSAQIIQHVRPLLDWARTSASHTEFADKVATKYYSSDEKREYLKIFRTVLEKASTPAPNNETLWQFLKHFHILSYDFDTISSKDEAAILSVLDLACNPTGTLNVESIWKELINQSQTWNQNGGTFTLAQLDSRLKMAVCSGRSAAQRQTITRLKEHSNLTLNNIQTNLVSNLHFPRSALLDTLIDAIESSKIIIIEGLPGAGKSAMVKMLCDALPAEITPFAFKAQEFNHPHLHQFLTTIGIGLTLKQLQDEFALLPRKVLLIDSAERLFELSNLDAFSQLIQQLRTDTSWTIVITCRNASAQMLKEHLLAQWNSEVTTIIIAPLTDEELCMVKSFAPQLTPLIENQNLNRLLRIPLILSLALKTFSQSDEGHSLSAINEQQLKARIWHQYVERMQEAQNGMPTKRNQCMLAISVQRAQKMSLFVNPGNCDAAALEALVNESILIKSASGGFAPAHDVLEDWAVVRFITQAFNEDERNPLQLFTAVGTEPAMRRGFRLWVADALASTDNERVMDFVISVFQRTDMPPLWHDEIAVSALQADCVGQFVKRIESLLLNNDKAIYRRLIHILRTACKGPNDSLLSMYGLTAYRSYLTFGTILVLPTGNGWRELIFFTHRHLNVFGMEDTSIVLGLLNDWSQGLPASGPLPPEAAAAAQICLKNWQIMTKQNFHVGEQSRGFLKVLFKIPHAEPGGVTKLIRSALSGQLRRHNAQMILEQVTKSVECGPLCQHFPELVIEVTEKTWCLQADSETLHSTPGEIEPCFGFTATHSTFFPESSLQGPFILLLGAHPNLAIDFIIRIANHAALSYSQSRMRSEVSIIQLPTAEGSRPLIASRRLYNLYRGLSTGPMVLECALRALDAWLLGQAQKSKDIRGAFSRILETSTSVATLAVLASVATAYPAIVGEQALPILRIRELYQWDFERSHLEASAVLDARASLGIPSGGIEEIYYGERKTSSELPHRKSNLEGLTIDLQSTSLRDEIWGMIDQFHAELPPMELQPESTKLWRVALYRMDTRNVSSEESAESGQPVLKQNDVAPDLLQSFAKIHEQFHQENRPMRLASWGLARFQGAKQPVESFTDWRQAFAEAQALWVQYPIETDSSNPFTQTGIGYVAACVVRDHYAELSPTDLTWCQNLIIEKILREDVDVEMRPENRTANDRRSPSRPCAYVLGLLLQSNIAQPTRSKINETLAIAVTHASYQVREYAAFGIRDWLWQLDPTMAKACVGGLFEMASTTHNIQKSMSGHSQQAQDGRVNALLAATTAIRKRIVAHPTTSDLNKIAVNFATHSWRELLTAIGMISPDTTDPDLCAFIVAHLNAAIQVAEKEEAWHGERDSNHSIEFQYAFREFFAKFALARAEAEAANIGQILVAAIEKCPKYLGVLLEAFPGELDKAQTNNAFWIIWKSVSEPALTHKLLQSSRNVWRYSELRKIVRTLLFADIQFKDGIREWQPVSVNRSFIEQAATIVADTKPGFGAILTLLRSVGQVFLPDAVIWLVPIFATQQNTGLLDEYSNAFQLETLLRKLCYEHGTTIRKRPTLHQAVLTLLDQLVAHGSHTAFRLRDYIVTPLPPNE
jgi:hypothetical protein